MCSFYGSALVAVAIALPFSSCDEGGAKRDGFSITMPESGEVILSDEHVAAYDWGRHQILLTEKGIEHWQSFVKFDKSHDPPIRQVGELNTKEFAVMIDGAEMYRGHFTSMVSSLGASGVMLYDTLGLPADRLTIGFAHLDGAETEDPRSRPEIEEYFRKQGKLKTLPAAAE